MKTAAAGVLMETGVLVLVLVLVVAGIRTGTPSDVKVATPKGSPVE
jgi:hypothetical protein